MSTKASMSLRPHRGRNVHNRGQRDNSVRPASRVRRILFCAATGAFALSETMAATHYLRAGASGNNTGSNWIDAWYDTGSIDWNAVSPGDTIYLAAGTYGRLNIIKSGLPGKPITFKRATAEEHGVDAGWESAYVGRVIIDGGGALAAIGIGEGGSYAAQSFITIDGAARYGIWLRNAYYGVRAGRGPSNNLTLRYLEIGHHGTYKMKEDGIQGYGDNLLVEYSYLHDNDNLSTHGDGIQWFKGNNITIRYNVMTNNGQIFMFSETVWGDDHVNNLNVYYNVFFNRDGLHYNGISKKLCPQPGYTWRIYNNVFDLKAKSDNGYDNLLSGTGSCAQIAFRNNAVIRSNASSLDAISHSHNAFGDREPHLVYNIPDEEGLVVAPDLGFVNPDAGDYRLAPHSPLIGQGRSVGLVRDFDGRPVPKRWPSIGAFEQDTVPTE